MYVKWNNNDLGEIAKTENKKFLLEDNGFNLTHTFVNSITGECTLTYEKEVNYPVLVRRDYRNQWNAVTYIPLEQENWSLKVSTFKGSRGRVYTTAQALKTERNMETFTMYQDYNKTVKQFQEMRATEKSIGNAHAESLAIIEQVVEEANEFYSKQLQEVN